MSPYHKLGVLVLLVLGVFVWLCYLLYMHYQKDLQDPDTPP